MLVSTRDHAAAVLPRSWAYQRILKYIQAGLHLHELKGIREDSREGIFQGQIEGHTTLHPRKRAVSKICYRSGDTGGPWMMLSNVAVAVSTCLTTSKSTRGYDESLATSAGLG